MGVMKEKQIYREEMTAIAKEILVLLGLIDWSDYDHQYKRIMDLEESDYKKIRRIAKEKYNISKLDEFIEIVIESYSECFW